MSLASTAILEHLPGEQAFADLLQRNVRIRLGDKNLRYGRLVHYKRVHYVYQLTFINAKGNRETLELPIPFTVEQHKGENLIYFDYRNDTLAQNDLDLLIKIKKIKSSNASIFYNKIVEIDYN